MEPSSFPPTFPSFSGTSTVFASGSSASAFANVNIPDTSQGLSITPSNLQLNAASRLNPSSLRGLASQLGRSKSSRKLPFSHFRKGD